MYIAKTNALISVVVIEKPIVAFVFAFAKQNRFSHDAAQETKR